MGSAGALQKDLKLGDVVAGMGACTNSNYAAQYGLGGTFAPIADFQLLSAAVESAKELGVRMDVGNLYSSDTFYDASNPSLKWADMGVLAIEMEPPPSTATPPIRKSADFPSARSPTISSPARSFRPRRGRRASPP